MKKILEATKIGALLISLVLVMSVVQAAFVSAQVTPGQSGVAPTQAVPIEPVQVRSIAAQAQTSSERPIEAFTIKLGETKTVAGNTIQITFDSITEALPLEVNTANFRVEKESGNTGAGSLLSLKVGEREEIFGVTFALLGLKEDDDTIVATMTVATPTSQDKLVYLNEKFELEPQERVRVVDYRNMKIKYMAMAIPACIPGNECQPFISFQASIDYGDVGTATEFSLSPGHSKEVFGAKVSLLEIEGSTAVMLVSKSGIQTESKLTVKAFDTSTGELVEDAKAIVVRNVALPVKSVPIVKILPSPRPVSIEPSARSVQGIAVPSTSAGGAGQGGGSQSFEPNTTQPVEGNITVPGEFGRLVVSVFGTRKTAYIQTAYATENQPNVTASGSVVRFPLKDAKVVVYGDNAQPVGRGLTNEDGKVHFSSLREGVYIITVEKEGFAGQKEPVKIRNDQTTEIAVTLYPRVVNPPTRTHKVVVDIIDADGRDSVTLRRGVYEVIVFAKDYSLFRHALKVDGTRDYNIKAPLSRGEYITIGEEIETEEGIEEFPTPIPIEETPIPIEDIEKIEEAPSVTVVKKVNGREVVEISDEVSEEQIETLSPAVKKLVSIKPVAIDPSKLEIKSGGITAITDSKLEIDKEKLFAVKGDTKIQVKVLPEEAYQIARRGIGEIKEVELEVTDKPVYITKKLQNANLFGFIPVQYEEETRIDASDGTEERTSPFWAPLAIPY